MGKRIVIKEADFSANGMKEKSYKDYTVTTEQGFVNSSMPSRSSNSGYLGSTDSNYAYLRTVHSNQEIILHAGDTIAIMEAPQGTDYVRMCAVSLNSTGKGKYPALICGSTAVKIGVVLSNSMGNIQPVKITNTSSADWTIILGAGTFKTTAPTAAEKLVAKYVGGVEQASPTTPEIAYRIYSKDEDDSAKEQNLDWEDNGGSENSGSNWDDNTGGGTEVEEDSGEGANDSEGA